MLNSPETIEGITFLADFYTNPKYKAMLPPDINSWTNTGNNEAWLAGTLGFTRNAYSLYAQAYADKNPVYQNTNTFAGFTGPGTDRVITTGGAQYFVILKGAKNIELAKATAKYLAGGPALLSVVEDGDRAGIARLQEAVGLRPLLHDRQSEFVGLRGIVEQDCRFRARPDTSIPRHPAPVKIRR